MKNRKQSTLFSLISDKWSKILYLVVMAVAGIVWFGAVLITSVNANSEFREDLGGSKWLKLKFDTIEDNQREHQEEIIRRLEIIERKI